MSRYHVKDSSRHVILGTQQFKPNEFASQINLSVENAWGILRCVIDICMKLEEGKYLILKDPNKQVIRVYSLPDGTFSSEEDEEDEEEEEEEEEGGQSGPLSLGGLRAGEGARLALWSPSPWQHMRTSWNFLWGGSQIRKRARRTLREGLGSFERIQGFMVR